MSETIAVSSDVPWLTPAGVPLVALPPGDHNLMLPGMAGPVEAALTVPAGAPAGFAIVCHPHPLMGGSMDNKVVTTLTRACRDAGLLVLRFNFRGVGASAGSFDHGAGERDDVLRLANWLGSQSGLPWRLLAGFSFGAFVSAQVLERLSQQASQPAHGSLPDLWLVAPPVTRFSFSAATLPPATQVIYGDADEVVDPARIADWLARAPAGTKITVAAGAGHFFHGQLGLLKAWAVNASQQVQHAD